MYKLRETLGFFVKHTYDPIIYTFSHLHLFSFKTLSVAANAATITKLADLSEEGDADCALEMRNGVKRQLYIFN
jgi:hypothetical protein